MNTTLLAALFMVVVLGMVLPYFSAYGMGKGIELDMLVSRDVYTLDNALDSVKYVFVKSAITYSFYQAAYNVSKQGGWIYPTSDVIADEGQLVDSLENKTLEYFGSYSMRPVKFFGYTIRLPKFQNMTITDYNDENITIEAYAPGLMESMSELENYATKERIIVRRNASMNLTVPTAVFKVHAKAITQSTGTEASLESVNHELNKWPLDASVELDHSYSTEDSDAFYKVVMSDYFQLLGNEPFSEGSALRDGEAIIATNIKLPEGEVVRDGDFIMDNKETSVMVKITPSCSGYTFVQNSIEKSHKECDFSYKVTVHLKTAIQEAEPSLYPVSNETDTVFEPIRFTFTAEKAFEKPTTS